MKAVWVSVPLLTPFYSWELRQDLGFELGILLDPAANPIPSFKPVGEMMRV